MRAGVTIFICFISVLNAFSQSPRKVYVHSFDSELDLAPLDNPVYVKKYGGGKIVNRTSSLPHPSVMEKMIKSANLQAETADMDQLAKDIFTTKVATRSINSVSSDYPKIDKKKMIKFKSLLRMSK